MSVKGTSAVTDKTAIAGSSENPTTVSTAPSENPDYPDAAKRLTGQNGQLSGRYGVDRFATAPESYLYPDLACLPPKDTPIGEPYTKCGKINGIIVKFEKTKDGKEVLTEESKIALKKLTDFLKESVHLKHIEIVGYVASIGDSSKEFEVSDNRAQIVKNFMVNQCGINERRLDAYGSGASDRIEGFPEWDNRIEFKIGNN